VSSNKLEKRKSDALKEKSQYAVAFGVIAMMLYITGFPAFVIFFFGILAYFIWKTLASPSHNGTRDIFEFYLLANEILRDDERRWYGFEVRDVIVRGERILQGMSGAPPLVYFTLGALYHKAGDHAAAVNQPSFVLENDTASETSFVYPTPELREYVKTLRKIERDPAEAPLMSSAVRALERARRNRGTSLLDESRRYVEAAAVEKKALELESKKRVAEIEEANMKATHIPSVTDPDNEAPEPGAGNGNGSSHPKASEEKDSKDARRRKKKEEEAFANRKTISEVLYDIYDAK
jgi:hypothetical protein